MSQSQLAKALGVAKETISRWENGHYGLSATSAFAIRSLLGTDEPKPARSKRRKSR